MLVLGLLGEGIFRDILQITQGGWETVEKSRKTLSRGKKGVVGGGNLRIFSPPGFKPGIDASRWLVAASQGPVLRRIRELHSAHEEGAV